MSSRISAISKRTFRESYNLNLLIVFFGGYCALYIADTLSAKTGIRMSGIIVSAGYFSIGSIAYRRLNFLTLILVTSAFLLSFFSYKDSGCVSFQTILSVLNSRVWPVRLYSLVLVPFTFLGICLDFYSIPYETKGMLRQVVFLLVMPILMRRELIKQRYSKILECLYSRGVECQSFIRKRITVYLWIVPLTITTLMEGVESTEYNRMLHTDIMHYEPTRRVAYATRRQKFWFFIILLLFVGMRIWRSM